MDCFGTYFTHVQTCNVTRGQSATQWTASVHTLHSHVQTCNATRVQSATEWMGWGMFYVCFLCTGACWMPLLQFGACHCPLLPRFVNATQCRKKSVDRWMHSLHSKKTRFRKTLDWKNTRNRINHCWRRLPREALETTSYNTNLCNFHIKKQLNLVTIVNDNISDTKTIHGTRKTL